VVVAFESELSEFVCRAKASVGERSLTPVRGTRVEKPHFWSSCRNASPIGFSIEVMFRRQLLAEVYTVCQVIAQSSETRMGVQPAKLSLGRICLRTDA